MTNHALRRTLVVLIPILLALANLAWASGQGKEEDEHGVTLKTPSGGFELSGTVKVSELALPAYPGARLVEDKDQGNLAFVLSRHGKPDVHFLVAKFETPDSMDRVRDFYKKALGNDVTKFTPKTDEGGMEFEMRQGEHQRKFVQLKAHSGMTEIDLVRMDGVTFSDSDDIEVK